MNIQIRNVPEDVHSRLTHKADLAGQSLQQYLSARLTELAERPSMSEIIQRIEKRQSFSLSYDDLIEAIDSDREERSDSAGR